MSLSIRSRFLLISVSITFLALLLFTSVIHKRVTKYKYQQEVKTNHIFADQIYQRINGVKDLNKIKSIISEKNNPVKMYAVLETNNGEIFVIDKNKIKSPTLNKILSEIKNNNSEGSIIVNEADFFWILKDSPEYKNKLLLVYPILSSSLLEFIKFFGLPFLISGILLLWMMVWASIILSSLVVKLQRQKQTLSDQAVDIEKARDDAMQANLAKSHFLANMSHEIRTPLTSIIGFAESCLDNEPTLQERTEATRVIIKNGKHLMHVINEVLDLSKIEAGKIQIEKTSFLLVDTLQDIDQLVSIMAEEKGLMFKINYMFPLPEKIITDELRLKQILINLCSNAIKFTEKGSVVLNIAYIEKMSSLNFEVIDTGIGMTEEQKRKIFNPFEQADSSTSRKYGGTGLGLTLSKQLLEMLDGTLTVISETNKGSKFTAMLKISEVENTNFIYEHKINISDDYFKQQNTNMHSLTGKILVAEDNKDIQALVKLLLKRIGVEFDIVENGKLAVELVQSADYDLVLMDIQMPVMDGNSAMNILKAQSYLVPVIAMTANAMKSDQEEYQKQGFSDFISKPIDRNDLYSVLMQYLNPVQSIEGDKTLLTSDLLHEDPSLIDLIDKFMSRLPTMRDSINLAYAENNNEEFSNLIHQLKGVGGGYGYPMLTTLCSDIEVQIKDGSAENVTALLQDLNTMCEAILAGSNENHKIAEENS